MNIGFNCGLSMAVFTAKNAARQAATEQGEPRITDYTDGDRKREET
jgi:hypothetical protein